MKLSRTAIASGVALALFAGVLVAQAPGLTRTLVAKGDVSVPGHEAAIMSVQITPGGVAAWHTHPGDEASMVVEGEVTVTLAGQPPKKVKAGEGFVIPAGTVHMAKNESATVTTKLVGVYFVDKSKPLASPAPEPGK